MLLALTFTTHFIPPEEAEATASDHNCCASSTTRWLTSIVSGSDDVDSRVQSLRTFSLRAVETATGLWAGNLWAGNLWVLVVILLSLQCATAHDPGVLPAMLDVVLPTKSFDPLRTPAASDTRKRFVTQQRDWQTLMGVLRASWRTFLSMI